MVLNLFKTLASKNEAAHHHRTHHQSGRNEAGYQRLGTTSGRISRVTGVALPQQQQHVPEVLASSGVVGSPPLPRRGGGGGLTSPTSGAAASHHHNNGRPNSGVVMMNRFHSHPLTGSLSAPSSPASLKSGIPLKMRHAAAAATNNAGIRTPPANIIVEKGRIEFVKTSSSSSMSTSNTTTTATSTMTGSTATYPPSPTPQPAQQQQSKLVMGAKIFRPPSSAQNRKSDAPSAPPLSSEESSPAPPRHKWSSSTKDSSSGGGSISFRDRSASPKFRESTPPLPTDSAAAGRIPSGRNTAAAAKLQSSSTLSTATPDVVNSRNIPRPGFIRSRETSPAPTTTTPAQQQSAGVVALSSISAKHIPAQQSKSGSTSTTTTTTTTTNNSSCSSSNGAGGNIPVPVSPNLIRWRAKLSGSSGPCVTSHLNNVSSSSSAIPASPVAGSNKNKTLLPSAATTSTTTSASLVKMAGTGAKSSSNVVSEKQQRQQHHVMIASTSSKCSTSPQVDESTTTTPADDVPVDVAGRFPNTSPCDTTSSTTSSTSSTSINQKQLLDLHYEVKRLEETVQTLLPLRHQQSGLIQSYEERLSEAQSRLAGAEAEVAQLKERLSRCEGAEVDGRQVIQQLEADKAAMSASHEQQRILFDKYLDEIANHVLQALISQKNLQGECRRLRSQVSDLEQRNVALNLLLTQSLRDSMLENNKKPTTANDGMVKSNSYEIAGNPRDSLCSTVSDSEIRLSTNLSIFEQASGGRPLVSKDSNWTLSSSSSSSSASQAALSIQQSCEQNPVERAEKLLAVLKHRLFSAQLNSYKSIRTQPRNSEIRRSLVLPAQQQQQQLADITSLPARPSTLSFCPTSPTSKETANDPSTPSVRALVQVLEKRVGATPIPAGSNSGTSEKAEKSPRPPLPLAPGLMRAIRNAAVVTGDNSSDSPASKDEGYSTMSSDVQVDSSSSSSSSFIASGCSSPATLRRSGSGSTPNSTTRSLPIAKRKTLLSSTTTASSSLTSSSSSSSDSRPCQPNRSISLQETHSGVGLEELKEEASDETNEEASVGRCADQAVVPSSGRYSDNNTNASAASSFNNKREWPGVQLGTLCEDWSPSSVATDSETESDGDRARGEMFAAANVDDDQNLQKWTSDSELYKVDQENNDDANGDDNWKTLDLRSRAGGVKSHAEKDSQHPLRRSRAHVQLADDAGPASSAASRANRAPNYSEHEMEDWILDGEHEPSPSEQSEEAGATALPAISEISYESDGDDEHEEDDDDDGDLFVPEIYSPVCDQETAESETEEEESPEESLDTEFTRDYYRLVKFESNRSLANSEKYDHCPPETAVESGSGGGGLLGAGPLPPPNRQVALQTVLDFIAEQQRYCAIRATADAASVTPELPHPSGLDKEASVSSLLQLRHLIPDDEDSSREEDSSDQEDDEAALHSGFSTNWMPIRSGRAELVDLNNAQVRASMLEKLFRSTSSSSSESGSCISFEGHGRSYRLESQDSCPPTIANPSAAEESHC